MIFQWNGHSLDFTRRTLVMGILNTTPDSFSDGGKFFGHGAAIEQALRMEADGADIIDVGGLSTRPGSEPVDEAEEIRRTAPVIGALAKKLRVPISIDTYRSEVARAALDAGASIVNDISGLAFDPAMAKTVAGAGVPVVLMHIKGTPRDMQKDPSYDALIPEVADSLRACIHRAEDAGIRHIVIDPGIGFGKTFDHNLEIINNLDVFTGFGRPVLVGPSRKAFIGHILGGLPAAERLEGTAAAVAACVLRGAHAVRVHDVREMARVVRVADAIVRQSANPSR